MLITNYLGKSYRGISLSEVTSEGLANDLEAITARALLLPSNTLYRVKSLQSALMKLQKYQRIGGNFRNCFNDLLGIRITLDDYLDVYPAYFKVVDMRQGKQLDDGYRGVHLYFFGDNTQYPIEIQIWNRCDADFNRWSHIHLYKLGILINVGATLRKFYEQHIIMSESDYRRELTELL